MKLFLLAFFFASTHSQPELSVDIPCPPGQTYRFCGTACPLRCGQPEPILCTLQCVQGCFCPSNLYSTDEGECVLKEECPSVSEPIPPPTKGDSSVATLEPTVVPTKGDPISPTCSAGKVFLDCGSACPPTCGLSDDQPCTEQCVQGCFCSGDLYLTDSGECVAKEECPTNQTLAPTEGVAIVTSEPTLAPTERNPTLPPCPENQVYRTCGSACPATCGLPDIRACTLQCVQGCFCSGDLYLTDSRECVPKEECPLEPTTLAPTEGTLVTTQTPTTPAPTENTTQTPTTPAPVEDTTQTPTTTRPTPSCPGKQVFLECGSACPLTCENQEVQLCTAQCVPGCFCPSGFFQIKDKCVAKCPSRFSAKKCQIKSKKDFVTVNGCRSRKKIVIKECAGRCRSGAVCQPSKTVKREAYFKCPGESKPSLLSYQRVVNCKCSTD